MGSLPQPGQPPGLLGDRPDADLGTMLAFGTVMALYHRDESGEGQEVDASLLGGNMYSQSLDMQAYLAIRDDRFLEPIDRLDASNPMSGPMYPCSDGRWVTLAMPDTDKYWPAFAEITGLDVDDPRFDSHEKRCEENRMEMLHLLEGIFKAKPGSHWKAELGRKQLPADVIEKYAYPANDEAAHANRYIVDVDHAQAGSVKSLGFPGPHGGPPGSQIRLSAPTPGQHTEEILGELPRGETPMKRPLDGIRVLDLTQWLQGPVCCSIPRRLRRRGDPRRTPGDGRRRTRSPEHQGSRGRRLEPVFPRHQPQQEKPRDRSQERRRAERLFYKLVAESDVFLSNFQMNILRAWGLTYEKLSEINPKLVYATNTGYGHATEVNRPSYDINVQALTGIMTRQGEPGQPPIYLGMGSGDTYGGMMSALGIMLALYQRRKTGKGQAIDASLYGAQLFMAAPTLQPFLASENDLYQDQQSRTQAA